MEEGNPKRELGDQEKTGRNTECTAPSHRRVIDKGVATSAFRTMDALGATTKQHTSPERKVDTCGRTYLLRRGRCRRDEDVLLPAVPLQASALELAQSHEGQRRVHACIGTPTIKIKKTSAGAGVGGSGDV